MPAGQLLLRQLFCSQLPTPQLRVSQLPVTQVQPTLQRNATTAAGADRPWWRRALLPAGQLLLRQWFCPQLPTPQLRNSKLLIKQVPLTECAARQLHPGGREVIEFGIIPLQAGGHLLNEGACAVAACDIWYVRFVLHLESRVRRHELSTIDTAVCFHHLARKLAILVNRCKRACGNRCKRAAATPRALPGTGLSSLPTAR